MVDSPAFQAHSVALQSFSLPPPPPHLLSASPSTPSTFPLDFISFLLILSPSDGSVSCLCLVRACWRLLRLGVTAVTLPLGLRPLPFLLRLAPPSRRASALPARQGRGYCLLIPLSFLVSMLGPRYIVFVSKDTVGPKCQTRTRSRANVDIY